jgi:GntR family transcriptional repressor for pyruvate dehydrogenase complex
MRPMAGPVERKADRVASDLMRRIVAGELPVGSLLPKEPELASEYGVNRSVIRESIKQLEVHRLVRPIKRRGTVVLDPLRSPSPDVVRAMLFPEPGVIDQTAFAELLEIRTRLDVEMTGLAAERRTATDLAAMDRCLGDLTAALGQPERYAEAMEQLTLAIAEATHNRIYQMLVHWHERVRVDLPQLQMVIRMANEPHLQGVAALIELIRKRKANEARRMVAKVHAWATPRMLAAAALKSGASLPAVAEGALP